MTELLEDVRNYLDITWRDNSTDKKLAGIIERGTDYIDKKAGEKQDYSKEGLARSLLFDYCRYARNDALELFEVNFRADLISLRLGVQVDDFARTEGLARDV